MRFPATLWFGVLLPDAAGAGEPIVLAFRAGGRRVQSRGR